LQLYSIYLSAANFASIARPLYVNPSSSNRLVRITLSYQLRSAAEAELLKQTPIIDADAIYRESDRAFEALSDLLGEDEYFFGEMKPGLFDASVFGRISEFSCSQEADPKGILPINIRTYKISKSLRFSKLR